MFFPAPNEPADTAITLCRTCTVQGACLAWALDVDDCHGVWGGTTPRERRAMRVAWRARSDHGDGPGRGDRPDRGGGGAGDGPPVRDRLLTLIPADAH